MAKISIGLAQMRCEKGDWLGNLASVENYMQRAKEAGVDVLVLPEMGLSGYCDPNKFPDAAQTLDSPLIQRFVDLTAKYSLAASGGFIEANPDGKPFITLVLADRGKVVSVYRKVNTAEDEIYWFTAGSETPVFDLSIQGESVPVALAICADSERPDLFRSFADKGAKVVFHSSAPGLYERRTDEASWWDGYNWYKGFLADQLPNYARENNLHIAVATQTGVTIDEDFPGGSFVFAPDGSVLAATPDYNEALLVYTIEVPVE